MSFMKAATMQPTIWIARLAKIVQENRLFGPTYQFDDMSVFDLERAVFLPPKLLEHAKESEENLIPPFSCRVITNLLEEDEVISKGMYSTYREGSDVNDIIMIPGGRFLFTMSEKHGDGVTYTKLWDLGQPNTQPSRITLLSRLAGQERICTTAPTPDGLGIRVITATTAKED
uniref:Uncharacterized protein n=1 Tax=Psilocybe cubensis TaxID=181762 RepID=A0A8H8CHM6_PSICU